MKIVKFIFILFILWSSEAYSQSFAEIKNKEVGFESFSEESLEHITANIYTFIGKDFDSLDLEMFLNGPIFGSALVQLASKEKTITYGMLYDQFLEFKSIPQYPEIKKKLIVVSELMKRPADFTNWEEDKDLFMQIGFQGEILEEIRLFIKENSDPTQEYRAKLEEVKQKKEEQSIAERKTVINEMEKLCFDSKVFDESSYLTQSKSENKPILLYFTGFSCINCRKIEQAFLFKPEIVEVIMQDYIFVPLYVDDRTPLPEEEIKEVKIRDQVRQLKTIGDKNMYFQIQQYNVASQPYFVVLNSENEIIETADYSTRTISDFLLFLNNSLDKFSNH